MVRIRLSLLRNGYGGCLAALFGVVLGLAGVLLFQRSLGYYFETIRVGFVWPPLDTTAANFDYPGTCTVSLQGPRDVVAALVLPPGPPVDVVVARQIGHGGVDRREVGVVQPARPLRVEDVLGPAWRGWWGVARGSPAALRTRESGAESG